MDKKPYLSKTILMNVLVSLAGILGMLGVPAVQAFVEGNAELILAGVGIVGIALRVITKGKIVFY